MQSRTTQPAADSRTCCAEHDSDDPELSILLKRLAWKCQSEGVDDSALQGWRLADLTKV